MENYAVDGYFLAQRVSGIQRYSLELLAALDQLLTPGELEIIVPPVLLDNPAKPLPAYQNIKIVPYGGADGRGSAATPGWEQAVYPRYLGTHGRQWLCTCNVIPLFYGNPGGIAVVHDVCYRARPDFFTGLRGRASAAWHRLQYRVIAARAGTILTDSEFSKQEIIKYYGVAPGKIRVVYCGWQHMERINPDNTVFAGAGKWPQLKPGQYYFSLSNLLKNKNFPWVLRAAKNKPEVVFAIAGGGSLAAEAEKLGLGNLPNVVYLGYVSDGEAKTLMANCKAFLFPTLYEGFGLPPLEAIACGAPQVFVSDTPCMREVFGSHAGYIDLAANTGDVDAITPGENAAAVLEKFSWAESARQLCALLRE